MGNETVELDSSLTLEEMVSVGRYGARLEFSGSREERRQWLNKSVHHLQRSIDDRCVVYGVNTGFGGMSGVKIDQEQINELQANLIWFLKAGAGGYLRESDVRSAMLLRINSFLKGASAVRLCLIERLQFLLNENVTPCVRELGSIGASGDLIPLASIAGAAIGLSDDFEVWVSDKKQDRQRRGSSEVLRECGVEAIELHPKEGLAMVNGTSVSTAMAASCLYDGVCLFSVALGTHGLMIQALRGMRESFDEFIHRVKPHPGQRWTAARMRGILDGSRLLNETRSGTKHDSDGSESFLRRLGSNSKAMEIVMQLERELQTGDTVASDKCTDLLKGIRSAIRQDRSGDAFDVDPVQDRYSIRCLPQFLGPIRDGLLSIKTQLETEMNSASDNPLIDDEGRIYHGGNFLAQYPAIAMDQLRSYLGLIAKHMDAQISLLVSPEFSDGLPPSLVGNLGNHVNMGLKGLQISGNSIMPLITYLGNPIASQFPTHAEQFNQNINSQSFASASLARQSIGLLQQYLSISLLFAIQAVELRTHLESATKSYDACDWLSGETATLYQAAANLVNHRPNRDKPLVYNDNEQSLERMIGRVGEDLKLGTKGSLVKACRKSWTEFLVEDQLGS